ncbi:MAG: condensation domain-containing protein [Phycicoccus sp.]
MTLTTAVPAAEQVHETLRTVWAELLALPPDEVPAEVSFLRLGGDSVLAVRMSAMVRQRLGVDLALADVRVDTTLTDLAALVARRATSVAPQDRALPVDLTRRDDPAAAFPLLPLQQGYFIGQQNGWELSYDSAHYYLDLALHDVDADEAPDALGDALRRLAEHQPTLRARVTADGRQHVLPSADPDAIPALRVQDLREDPDPDAAVDVVRHEMSTRGPDPTDGPGVDARLSLLPAGRARLHLSLSLLLVDGWSANLLTRELLTLASDVNATLAPVDIDFGDYVDACSRLPGTSPWQADRDWWQAHLETLPAPPALPLALDPREARPQVMTNREVRVPADTWAAMRHQCTTHGVTPSAALLAVYSASLARWAGHHRLLVNTLQLNRLPLHPDVHRVIGAFASTMLLPLDLPVGGTFAELAAHAQQRFADHSAHNLYSGVEVGRELSRLRGSTRPVAPVVFLSTIGMDAAMQQGVPGHAGPLGEVDVSDHHQQLRTPQVALEARLFELNDELVLVFSTVEDVLSTEDVDRVFAEFTENAAALADPAAWRLPVEVPDEADPPTAGPALRLGRLDDPRRADADAGAPRDDLERTIAAVFAEVLAQPVPDRAASFFALGGDSLLAVRALARLAGLGVNGLTVRDVVDDPSVAGLAAAARDRTPG